MKNEIEIKLKIKSAKELISTLKTKFNELDILPEKRIIDTYFDNNDELLNKSNKSLKIRISTITNSLKLYMECYLVPAIDIIHSDIKNIKIHPWTNVEDIEILFRSLGYYHLFTIERIRQEFEATEGNIYVDSFKEIGDFVKIKAENKETINKVLKKYDIKGKIVKDSYFNLFRDSL